MTSQSFQEQSKIVKCSKCGIERTCVDINGRGMVELGTITVITASCVSCGADLSTFNVRIDLTPEKIITLTRTYIDSHWASRYYEEEGGGE